MYRDGTQRPATYPTSPRRWCSTAATSDGPVDGATPVEQTGNKLPGAVELFGKEDANTTPSRERIRCRE